MTAGTITHRCLLGAMVVCAFISIVPPLRFAGALSVRALALLDLVALGTTEKATWQSRLMLALKAAGVILAIVGIIMALIPLSIAAFGIDIGLQLKGMWDALRDPKASPARKTALFCAHFAFLVVDVLAIAAIATGGWQLAVAAASVSAATMFVIGIASLVIARTCNDFGSFFDGLCYLALAGLGIAVAQQSARVVVKKPTARFDAENKSEDPMALMNNKGQVVAVVEPGETAHVEIPRGDASNILISQEVSIKPVLRYDPYWDDYYTQFVPVEHNTISPPFVTGVVNGQATQVFGVNAHIPVTLQEGVLPNVIPALPMVPQAIPVDLALDHTTVKEGSSDDGDCMTLCGAATVCAVRVLTVLGCILATPRRR